MKQTMNYLSMAALVVMGAILSGCAKETPAAEEENIVTLSVSVGLPEDESTKALDIGNCYRYSRVKPRNFLIFVPKKYGEF